MVEKNHDPAIKNELCNKDKAFGQKGFLTADLAVLIGSLLVAKRIGDLVAIFYA